MAFTERGCMIRCQVQGNFKNITKFLNRDVTADIIKILNKYGKQGVDALAAATPVDTGVTADSWSFTVTARHGTATIAWHNSNENDGIPIVILIQYGHATRNGGYVEGRDFINPAIAPILDKIAKDAWKEVTDR